MSTNLFRDNDRARFSKLEDSLKKLTPSWDILENALKKLPGSQGLGSGEKFQILRGLERIWHIMRLLNLLSRYFGDRMVFGGGSIINYIYMIGAGRPPRLTFDLDASWYRRVAGKRVLLKEVIGFNKWLAEIDGVLEIPVDGGKNIYLYIVEYDVEKDYFPRLLSLRVPVITRYDGRVFYEFLGIREYDVIKSLRKIFSKVLGVANARIDYIRFEVMLDPQPVEPVILNTRDILGFRQEASITPLEYQLAVKLEYKLGRDYGVDLKYNIHDLLKALLDLRLLRNIDLEDVLKHISSRERVRENAWKNIEAVLSMGARLWSRNYHYILIRRIESLEEIAREVGEIVMMF